MPGALLSRVDHAAAGRGVGRSEFVRQALAAQADAVLGESPDDDGSTLYDVLAADGVIGRFAGPRGLSTAGRAAIRERVRTHLRTGGGSSHAGEPHEAHEKGRETAKDAKKARAHRGV